MQRVSHIFSKALFGFYVPKKSKRADKRQKVERPGCFYALFCKKSQNGIAIFSRFHIRVIVKYGTVFADDESPAQAINSKKLQILKFQLII